MKKGRVFIVSAPSGAGKTTLVESIIPLICKTSPIAQVKTYTTKQPRCTDTKKTDFHFVSIDQFEQLIQQNFFLEWSNAYGAYYGTPRSIINEMVEGKSHVLVIDRVGAKQVAQQVPDAVLIWIAVHDLHVLKSRLLARGTETDEQVARRLARAQVEIDDEIAAPCYHYHVKNDDVTAAKNELVSIILAELADEEK